jgi:putative NADPH-quinone reductase
VAEENDVVWKPSSGRRVVIIQGHPDPGGKHLCHALADAYAEGAAEAGHHVTRIEVATLDFPMLKSQAEFESEPLPRSLVPSRDAIMAANHIVIVFPLWLGTTPAILKAFLENLMRPGIGFSYRKDGMPKKLLTGRSARIIVTMGMPAWLYRWYFFSHGVRNLKRNILRFVGIAPIRQSLLGGVEQAGEARRKRWLVAMRQLGQKLR